LGTTLQLENLHGQKLNVKIQPGIQNGTKLLLKGQGLTKPSYHGARDKGDVILEIIIETPTELTEAEEELYSKLKDILILKTVVINNL
jgi:DnaJ-class molecular chaperone